MHWLGWGAARTLSLELGMPGHGTGRDGSRFEKQAAQAGEQLRVAGTRWVWQLARQQRLCCKVWGALLQVGAGFLGVGGLGRGTTCSALGQEGGVASGPEGRLGT